MGNRSSFPRVFWVANSIEIFERFAYYGIYMGFGIYLQVCFFVVDDYLCSRELCVHAASHLQRASAIEICLALGAGQVLPESIADHHAVMGIC